MTRTPPLFKPGLKFVSRSAMVSGKRLFANSPLLTLSTILVVASSVEFGCQTIVRASILTPQTPVPVASVRTSTIGRITIGYRDGRHTAYQKSLARNTLNRIAGTLRIKFNLRGPVGIRLDRAFSPGFTGHYLAAGLARCGVLHPFRTGLE